MLPQWLNGVFCRIENVNPNIKRFWVELPELDKIDFVPGQFMTFDLPIHEKKHRRLRSYSIASAPDGTNVLEFVIVLLEGGLGTTYLFKEVKVGTPLRLRGALGKFTLPETLPMDRELCFICTGTGLAPFRSMLLDIRNRKLEHPPMHLIFGTRHRNGILYYEDMQALTQSLNLQYHVTLSREKAPEWEGRQGYVHHVYEELYADRRQADFYLCGWQVMLDQARQHLEHMDYAKKHIIFESYG